MTTYLHALASGAARDNECLLDGSAKLLLALVKNVNHGFHSRMNDIVVFLLAAFRPRPSTSGEAYTESDMERDNVIAETVRRTIELLGKHADADHVGTILPCLAKALQYRRLA